MVNLEKLRVELNRLKKHYKMLKKHGAEESSELFAYQQVESPYYDEDWGGVDHGPLESDVAKVVGFVLEAWERSNAGS